MLKKVNNKNFHIYRILLFIALTLSYAVIFSYHGKPVLTNAIDGTFHIERILSLKSIFVSPVNFDYFNHNGPVVSLFYPWLMVYPMYLCMLLTKSIIGGYYLYISLMTYLTLELCYWTGKTITKRNNVSILFAIIYTFALVRTTNIYCRMALGEVIAMTFLPVILLGIYQIFYQDKPKFWVLTIGMTCIVYTHMISFYISVLLVGFFLIINLISRNINKAKFIALLKAIGSTILLTLAFFIPMLQIYFTTKIEPPVKYNLADTSEKLSDMIVKSLNNQIDASDVLGAVCLVFLIIAVINFTKFDRFGKDSLIVAGIFTILCTKLIPWYIFGPLFEVVQFPWRFLVVTTLIASLYGAISLLEIFKDKNLFKVVLCASVIIVGIHWTTMYNERGGSENPGISDKDFIIDIKKYTADFNGSGDYRPKDTNEDYYDLIFRNVKIGNDWIQPKSIKYNAEEITFVINNYNNDKKAILPVWSYPGETVRHNGKEIPAKRSYNGATEVPLKKGKNTFIVKYEYTTLAKIGFTISIVSLITFIFIGIKNRISIKNRNK